MDPNPKMMAFVEKYKKTNKGAYPDSWAVMAYESLYLYKAAAEKAKTIETEAVIKAMEGTNLDILRGAYQVSWTTWELYVLSGTIANTIPLWSGRDLSVPGAGDSA
jgi:ABC-type branched-subunit amino acid transport system substrate-binding protein